MPQPYDSVIDVVFDLTLLLVSFLHVILVPYTKVEESFSIQAIHDILTYGVTPASLTKYDHQIFPGAVPRSFVGPLLLSFFSYPFLAILRAFSLLNNTAQASLYIRLSLASLNVASLVFFSYSIFPSTARSTRTRTILLQRRIFITICALQFQLLFWAGRTTPNGIITPLVFTSLALVFSRDGRKRSRNYYLGLALLTASQVIARMELIGIVIPIAVVGLFRKDLGGTLKKRFNYFFFTGALSALSGIVLSVLVDTYFWRRPFKAWNPLKPFESQERGFTWPELEAILFNVVQGKSSDWGISPWHSYITNHVPKLISFVIPLALLGIGMEAFSPWRRIPLLFVISFHIALLSQLGHKETRFIGYLTPLINTFAANGATFLLTRRRRWWRRGGQFGVLVAFIGTAFVTMVSLRASAGNYPGGEAMKTLHQIVDRSDVTVHIDVLPAMTGVTLFQSSNLARPSDAILGTPLSQTIKSSESESWIYDKSEDLDQKDEMSWQQFTHLISDDKYCHLPSQFTLLQPDGFFEFKGLGLRSPTAWLASLLTAPRICLQQGQILQWQCLDALLPVRFKWHESVWLCVSDKLT